MYGVPLMEANDTRMTEQDETAEIRAAQQDPRAFAVLYERYVDRIYSYVYHRVGNVYEAEDLTSRTFFRALSHLESYVDKGYPFSAWLYRIAHNLIANWYRDRGRRPVVSLETLVLGSPPEEHPESMTQDQDDRRFLQEVIADIDPLRQELLVLKFAEGLSNAEIGAVLGRSEGAIKSLYHRTLLQLRKQMRERGLEIDVDE
jgi:RNA polymerase sigma-70 factor, ECF subfamily